MSTEVIVLLAVGVVVLVCFAIWRTSKRGGRVTPYFLNAVKVWILADDDAARLAALTAAKVASMDQRVSMVSAMHAKSSELEEDDDPAISVASKLGQLTREIGEKDWRMRDLVHAKQDLHDVDKEYGVALDKSDPDVFRKRHPNLFDR